LTHTDGSGTTNEAMFRLEYTVAINAKASGDGIWTLLTDAADIPRCNSTIKMVEVFKDLMLPVIKRKLPDFVPQFEQYAKDLKTESERET
jgi:hypothetical protein